jgi:hypothetical protein
MEPGLTAAIDRMHHKKGRRAKPRDIGVWGRCPQEGVEPLHPVIEKRYKSNPMKTLDSVCFSQL